MDNVIGGLFFLIFFALWLAAIIFWIMSIIEVVKIPEHQYKAAGTEKIVWVLIVVLLGFIGALVWRFVKRNDVMAASGSMPSFNPSPGYGVGPGTSGGDAGYQSPGQSGANPVSSTGSSSAGGAAGGSTGGSGAGGPAPGWYPDPGGGSGLRWWDGSRWTEDRR